MLREDVDEWFDLDADSPYMLLVADVCKDKQRAMTVEQEVLFGIDKLNVVRSDYPGGHACRSSRRGFRPCIGRPTGATTGCSRRSKRKPAAPSW